ncbi:hypothetical protein, partial [Hymenobacter agri]
MKSGQKFFPASVVVVASLLAWWAPASPLAKVRLSRAWLRAQRTLALDTPRTDTLGPYKPSRRP